MSARGRVFSQGQQVSYPDAPFMEIYDAKAAAEAMYVRDEQGHIVGLTVTIEDEGKFVIPLSRMDES